MGRLLGKARCTITNYERGVGHPPLETLANLAVILQVQVDALLGLRKVYNREKRQESKMRRISESARRRRDGGDERAASNPR